MECWVHRQRFEGSLRPVRLCERPRKSAASAAPAPIPSPSTGTCRRVAAPGGVRPTPAGTAGAHAAHPLQCTRVALVEAAFWATNVNTTYCAPDDSVAKSPRSYWILEAVWVALHLTPATAHANAMASSAAAAHAGNGEAQVASLDAVIHAGQKRTFDMFFASQQLDIPQFPDG
jgi:hypothetical protein